MSEFDLIRRLQEIICAPAEEALPDCVIGIGDDGAVLQIPEQHELVVCTDTLVEGIHFLHGVAPDAVGHKALAVNLSDLAAMGAAPAWFFLALTLPDEDPQWLDEFAHGMARLARRNRISLAGGDLSSGPMSITITALGLVEEGQALTRCGANAGDLVVVSGDLGSAAHALQTLLAERKVDAADLVALEKPEPRLALGHALAGIATSCIDISDGFSADLGHVLERSAKGAEIELGSIPCSASLRQLHEDERWRLQLAGGDDYELCFTLPPGESGLLGEISTACEVKLTVVGTIRDEPGLVFRTPGGDLHDSGVTGYQHFHPAGSEFRP